MKKLAICTAFLLAGVPFARTIVPQAPNLFGDCYRITTAEELYGFAEIVNKGETNACGILMNDVVVNADSIDTDYAEWTPIGTKENPFKGSFRGEHNTIRGLYSKNFQSEAMGFLGYVTEDSTALTYVYNLGLEDVHFEGSGSIGAFVGIINSNNKVYFDDVYATGTIKGYDGSVVGGFAGTINGKTRISEAYNTVTVSGSSASSFIGKGDSRNAGISVENDLHFTNCYALSDYAMVGGDNVNGISTYESKQFQDGTVAVKLNRADDPRSDYPTYWTQEKGVDHPKFYSRKEKLTYSPFIYHMPDGTTQTSYYRVVSDLIKLDSINDNNFCFMGWYKSPDFSGSPETVIPKYSYGTQEFWAMGLPKDKEGWCLISSADDLYHFAQGVNTPTKYILGNDTIFNSKLTADIIVNKNVLDKDGNPNKGEFRQWVSIGKNSRKLFYGSIDGDGHTISGLYSDTCTYYANFIERMNTPQSLTNGSIRNLGIVDSYFKSDMVTGFVDVFFSKNFTLENCFFEGTLIGTTYASGLMGNVYNLEGDATIKNSHFKGKIEAERATGLIKSIQSQQNFVQNSYAEATVNDAIVEGLIGGIDNVTMSNCYFTAAATGKNSASLINYIPTKGTIVNSYAINPHFNSGNSYSKEKINLVKSPAGKLKIINSYILIDKETDTGEVYPGLVAYPKEKFEDGTVATLLREYCTDNVCGNIWGQDVQNGETLPHFTPVLSTTKVPYLKLTLHTYSDDPNAQKYPTKFVKGHRLALPTADLVKRDNYYFAGWYKSSDFKGNPVHEIDSTETKNVELYAKFIPEITITLVEYDGKISKIPAGKGLERKFPVPFRSDYIFAGWYSDKNYNSSMLMSVTSNKDTTFYAKWFQKKTPPIENGCYQVSTVEELYGLEYIDQKKVCSELTNDIVVNKNVLNADGTLNEKLKDGFAEWTPITTRHRLFNGNGHTISGLYYDVDNVHHAGFFGIFENNSDSSYIRNVGIKDSYFRARENVGGLAGSVYKNVKIENSFFEGVLVARYDLGGLVGIAYDTINIVNSYHVGPIISENPSSIIGALLGIATSSNYNDTGTCNIINSYHIGDLLYNDQKCDTQRGFCGIIGNDIINFRNPSKNIFTSNIFTSDTIPTIENLFYHGTTIYPIEKFANGTVAKVLHNYNENGVDGSVWGQDISAAQKHPVLSGSIQGSKTSFVNVTLHTFKGDTTTYPTKFVKGAKYAPPSAQSMARNGYVFSGWFNNDEFKGSSLIEIELTTDTTLYGKWVKIRVPKLVGDCYQIYDIGELYGFADIVKQGKANACGELQQDIALNYNVLDSNGNFQRPLMYGFTDWVPIGDTLAPFNGQFYGNGHTISGLYKMLLPSLEARNVGLFGYVNGGTSQKPVTIYHLGVSDSYFQTYGLNLGEVAGFVSIVGKNGNLKISRSYNSSTLYAFGGFVGHNYGRVVIDSSFSLVKLVKGGDALFSSYETEETISVSNTYCLEKSRFECSLIDAKAFDSKKFRLYPEDSIPEHTTVLKNFYTFTADVQHFSARSLDRKVLITGAAAGQKFALLDVQGRVIMQGIVQNRNFTLNTPKPGSYIVRIGHDSQMIKVH